MACWLGRDGGPVGAKHLRPLFKGPIIVAGFELGSAEAHIESGDSDMVALGRHFIANSDLPERFRRQLPLYVADRTTFYGGSEVGYTDYPFYSEDADAA
jgi:N-ethylmaleimide reductase